MPARRAGRTVPFRRRMAGAGPQGGPDSSIPPQGGPGGGIPPHAAGAAPRRMASDAGPQRGPGCRFAFARRLCRDKRRAYLPLRFFLSTLAAR